VWRWSRWGCTSALLLNNAQRARNNLIVGKQQRTTMAFGCDICQTVHGASPVVYVVIVVDDLGKDAG
jgi:hypothetical protein